MKKLIHFFCSAIVCSLLSSVLYAQGEGFSGQGRYRIDNVASGKSLDVRIEDKRTVQQWSANGNANQQWDIEDAGAGFVSLRSVDTGKYLDFAENRLRDGLGLIVADRTASDNQRWKIADTGNSQFTIVSKSGKALDVPATLRANDGTKLQTMALHGLENQRFRFVRLGDVPVAQNNNTQPGRRTFGGGAGNANPAAPAVPVDPNARYAGVGRYSLQFIHSNKALDLNMGDQEAVQQWTLTNARNQLWDIEDAGGGFVFIRSAENGKVLTLTTRRTADGTAVNAQIKDNRTEQKWRIVDLGNGEYSIVSALGRALDLHAFSMDDGVTLQVWQANRAANQRLRLTRAAAQVETYVRGRNRGESGTPVTQSPVGPPVPAPADPYVPGTLVWRGKVDMEVLLDVRGGQVSERTVAGSAFNNGRILRTTGTMPLAPLTVRLRAVKPRGTVEIVEQPNANNNWTAVVRIKDPQGGAADYEIELSW